MCSITHYDITIGDDVARDVHGDIIVGYDVVMSMMLQCILMLLGHSFIMYYYTLL